VKELLIAKYKEKGLSAPSDMEIEMILEIYNDYYENNK